MVHIMHLLWQEVKQEKWLTQESQEIAWVHLESEGDKGILKYNVLEAENPSVDAVLMHEWEGDTEPSFLPLWIACCDECRTRNEVETCLTVDVLSLTSDMGVRDHVVRNLASRSVVRLRLGW